MAFEFDQEKSARNKQKHGIGFHEAQALGDDPELVEIPAKAADEPRVMIIGKIGGKHRSAVITHRGDNIRFISVRRSGKEELDIYESIVV